MCMSDFFNAYAAQQKGGYLNSVARTNAAMSDTAAKDSLRTGAINADEQRKTTQQVIGSQRTGFAANGIDVNTGSAGIVQNDSAALGELDALTIMNNAAREAYGYKVQAIDQRQQGQLAKYSGKMEAVGSILGGVSKGAMLMGG